MDNTHSSWQGNAPGRGHNRPRVVWRNGGHKTLFSHFLEMCTVSAEVFFRRGFGERWLTVANFFIGLLVLLFFTAIEWFMQADPGIWLRAFTLSALWGSESFDPYEPRIMLMPWIVALYLVRGAYHFFRMFWDKRTYDPEHSFDNGISIFEPIAYRLVLLINWLTKPLVKIFMVFLPKSERRRGGGTPPLINNISNFSNLIVEPLFMLLIAYFLYGAAVLWLSISAVAVFIHARYSIGIRRNRMNDFHDSIVAARDMHDYYYRQNAAGVWEATPVDKSKGKKKAQKQNYTSQEYPDLDQIIDDLNRSNKTRTGGY